MIKKLIKRNFKALVFFYRYLRYRVAIMFAASVLVSLIDGIGLSLFLPLLSSTDNSTQSYTEGMGRLSEFIHYLESMGVDLTLNNVLIIMLVIFTVKGAMKYFEKYYSTHCRYLFLMDLRNQMVNGVGRMKYAHYVTSDSGKIQNALTTETNRMVQSFTAYFTTMQNFVMSVVYILLAFDSNPKFAILVSIFGFASNVIYKYLYKLTQKISKEISSEGNQFQKHLIQAVTYFKYLKATNSFKTYMNHLKDKVQAVEHANFRIGKLNALMVGSREIFVMGAILLVILIHVNYMGGSISTILLSLLFFYRSLGTLITAQSTWNVFQGNYGALEGVMNFLTEMNTYKSVNGIKTLDSKIQNIKLTGLSFSYVEGKDIIENVSVEINANETIALVGESGSGKTTLANMVSGLLDEYRGSYTIDGIELKEINRADLANQIGYISQDPVIFDDTIYNNITLWDEDNEENKIRFHDALKKAAIYDFVESLPEKEQANLGTNGVLVSGGQKQRLSIARELYKNVSLLILDEATSALDSETEKLIQQNFDALKGSVTLLVIAHRLSTIKNADRIYLMDQGKILDEGNFQELFDKNEKFRKMVNLQEFG